MSDSEELGLPRLHREDPDEPSAPSAPTSHYKPSELLSASLPDYPHFVVVRGARSLGTIHRLRSEQVVGRALSADIQLAEPGVSRRHAKITLLPAHHVLIEDLGSSNGMFCDGERVDRKIMSPGDSIQLGNARLVLLLMDDVEAGARERRARREDTRLPTHQQIIAHFGDALDYAERFEGHAAICALAPREVDAVFAANGTSGVASLLRRIAQVISDVIGRDDALVGRLGFGTLGLSLPDTDLPSAVRTAEWIRRVVANTEVAFDDSPWKVTLTVGAAASSEGERRSAPHLIHLAQRRLHLAAGRGGNCTEPSLESSGDEEEGS